MPDKVCYTAIFGDYDDLKEPLIVTPGWRYVCFTDQDLKSQVWNIVNCGIENAAPGVIRARDFKINGFALNNPSLYIDASFQANCDLNEFWNKHFVSPMTVVQHPMRDCAYEEASVCQRNNRAPIEDIAKQIGIYSAEGLPMNSGLIQSGILLRESIPEVRKFCSLWWEQISLSTRDQIGFAYAEWKLGVRWPRITGFDYRTSKDFIFKTHKHRRHASPYRNN